jgi:AmmeMemoRadiSam system protein A
LADVANTVPPEDALRLARFARARIAEELGGPAPGAVADDWAHAPGASFVTLHRGDGRLQGCIGSLEPRRPLVDDVEHNALAAAFWDPRADQLTLRDVDDLDVEVSILSPLEPVGVASEDEARQALRPGVDGVVLAWHEHRATFLPQVWDELPDAGEFLAELKRKAGLPGHFWDPDVRLLRYTVCAVHDGAPAKAITA